MICTTLATGAPHARVLVGDEGSAIGEYRDQGVGNRDQADWSSGQMLCARDNTDFLFVTGGVAICWVI